MAGRAGLILQTRTGPDHDGNGKMTVQLEPENARLRKEVEDLDREKRMLQERILKLERKFAQLHRWPDENREKEGAMTVVLSPHLFMKAFTLMRSSTKPLVLRVVSNEVADVNKMNVWI